MAMFQAPVMFESVLTINYHWCWQHGHSPESDSEGRHKRHKRDHRDSSRRSGGYEELEDGELGEDGEIQ